TIHLPSGIDSLSQFAFGSHMEEDSQRSLTTIYIDNTEDIAQNIAGIFTLSSKVILNSAPVKLSGVALYSYEITEDEETVVVYDFMDIFELIQIFIDEDIMPDIYVPQAHYDDYYTADGWNSIYEYIIPYDTIYNDFVVTYNDDEAEIVYYKGDDTAVNIPSEIEGKPVTSIAAHAFNTMVTSVDLGENIKNIKDYAFYKNDSLQTVMFPHSLEKIGDYAFAHCYSIENIVLSDNVKSVGDYAFYDCNDLLTVELNEDLESIGEYAFAKCISIVHMTIPSTVAYMGNYVFNNCDLLSIIFIKSSAPPELDRNGLYYETLSNVQIFVYDEFVDTYKTNTYWSKYSFRIHAIEGIADNLLLDNVYAASGEAQLTITTGGLFDIYIAPEGITDRGLLHTDYEQPENGEEDNYYNQITALEDDRLNTIIDLPALAGEYVVYVVYDDEIISTGTNVLTLQ
ncbi:MAG: leucine-rich repeat domain-containing protein, partial [Bacillota bacterium]